jgi:RNA 2',3'-cyclic 3'-phosphodiesterase
VRLFLALDLPEDVRAALARWGEASFRASPSLRQVAAADLHVTVAFLGWRPCAQAGEIWSAVRGAVSELALPRLEPGAVMPAPRRRPRLLALDLADPTGAATAWHRAVSDALAEARLYEPERRTFWPHVTLARARKGARVRAPREGPELRAFDATALTLYRSDLSAAGARYTALEQTG